MKNLIGKLRIGRYLRELSIVIVGIFISLAITSKISTSAKEREVKQILQLVKIELEDNLAGLEDTANRYGKESKFWHSLIEANLNLDSIPYDTLKDHRRFIQSIQYFRPSNDTFEALKSSSLMQHIADKQLIINIVKSYNAIYAVQLAWDSFIEMRVEAMQFDIDINELTKKNTIDYFKYCFSQLSFKNYLYVAPYYLDSTFFIDHKIQIIKTIDMIH